MIRAESALAYRDRRLRSWAFSWQKLQSAISASGYGYSDSALDVEAQEVVPAQTCAGGWGMCIKYSLDRSSRYIGMPEVLYRGVLV